MLTKEYLRSIRETELRTQVLIPLLRAMGFQDVFEYHGGSGEQGKDIIFWKEDELKVRINYAVVAKATVINGQAQLGSGTAGEVSMQVSQCFGKAFIDPKTSEERLVHICWIVTNQEIKKEAADSIGSFVKAGSLSRNIRFVDGDTLWELVERYLPAQSVLQKLTDVAAVFDDMDPHYRAQAKVAGKNIELGIQEKYPGAGADKPMEFSATFEFPPTPEGNQTRQAYEQHLATGAPIEIPADFIQQLEMPEFARKLLGLGDSQLRNMVLGLGPLQHPGDFPVRIDIQCKDGDSFSLEYVHLKVLQAGKAEVTLTNDHQPNSVSVKVVLQHQTKAGTISFKYKQKPLNVKQFRDSLKLQRCLGKPVTIKVADLNTDILMFQLAGGGTGEQPPDPFIDAISALTDVQTRLSRKIDMPDREPTEVEWQTIARLQSIVRTGTITGTWDHTSFSMDSAGAKDMLEGFGNGRMSHFRTEVDETVELFGTQLPLGICRTICEEATLANEAEVRAALDQSDESTSINIELVPGSNRTVTRIYIAWQDEAAVDNENYLPPRET